MKKLLSILSLLLVFSIILGSFAVFAAENRTVIVSRDMSTNDISPFIKYGYITPSFVNGAGIAGSKALRIVGSNGGYEAKISCEPNATYEISGNVKANNTSSRVLLGMKGIAAERSVPFSSTSYTYQSCRYTTAANQTQLTAYIYIEPGCSKDVYLSDVNVAKISSNPSYYGVNLIQNGSFEEGSPSNIGVYYFNTYPKWNITGGQLEIHKSPVQLSYDTFRYNAADGDTSAELNSNLGKPATIYQDFNTNPGSVLEVKFAYNCRNGFPTSLAVHMGAPGQESSVTTVSTSTVSWQYKTFQYTVPAGQNVTRLKFVSLNGNTSSCANDIDDISVIEKIPAPRGCVVTGTAINIEGTTATIINNTYSNISNPYQAGIEYSTNPNMSGSQQATGPIGNPFSINLSGLAPDTAYYYQAYVASPAGVTKGEIKSFRTASSCGLPTKTIVTGNVTNIADVTASVVNNTYTGFTGTPREAGIEYSTNSNMSGSNKTTGNVGSPYSVNLSGLKADTTYYYRAYAVCSLGHLYTGEIKSFKTTSSCTIPTKTVVTGNASNVADVTASVVNNTYTGFTGTPREVGIEYSTSPNMSGSSKTTGVVGSPYSVNLSGLKADTTYYYRAYVICSLGNTFTGETKSFKTTSSCTIPTKTIVTGNVTNITKATSTIVSNTYTGFVGTPREVGIEFSTSANMSNSGKTAGTVGSPYSVNLSGLKADTTYYYRAYVICSLGNLFTGEIKSFKTPVTTDTTTKVVITGPASALTETTANITTNSYIGFPNKPREVGIEYSTNQNLSGAVVAKGIVGDPFAAFLSNLTPSTTYYYRAYVIGAGSNKFYGEIKCFRTCAKTPDQPDSKCDVTTGMAIGVSTSSANISNNTYKITGTGSPSEVGVIYGRDENLSDGVKVKAGSVTTPFATGLSSLYAGNTYYYQAYAIFNGETVKGEIKAFTTLCNIQVCG